MVAVHLRGTPTTPTTAMTPSSEKRVRSHDSSRCAIADVRSVRERCTGGRDQTHCEGERHLEVCVPNHFVKTRALTRRREDDTKWPQKNKDGRQELEIRLGSEHISFEVCSPCEIKSMRLLTLVDRQNWFSAGCAGLVRSRGTPRVLLPCSGPEGSGLLINLSALQGTSITISG